jgi:hypothetical protein
MADYTAMTESVNAGLSGPTQEQGERRAARAFAK